MGSLGKMMCESGFEDIVIEAGLCASGSIEQVMSGKHYNRAMWVRHRMLDALERIMLLSFEGKITSEDSLHRVSVLASDPTPSNLLNAGAVIKHGRNQNTYNSVWSLTDWVNFCDSCSCTWYGCFHTASALRRPYAAAADVWYWLWKQPADTGCWQISCRARARCFSSTANFSCFHREWLHQCSRQRTEEKSIQDVTLEWSSTATLQAYGYTLYKLAPAPQHTLCTGRLCLHHLWKDVALQHRWSSIWNFPVKVWSKATPDVILSPETWRHQSATTVLDVSAETLPTC